MTARAIVETDFMQDGIRVAISPRPNRLIVWAGSVTVKETTPEMAPDSDMWLPLDRESGRALYEALADHFGHSGNDNRALRRDYDAERARVDRLIGHITKEKP